LVSFNALYHTSYNIDLFNFPLVYFAYGNLLLFFRILRNHDKVSAT